MFKIDLTSSQYLGELGYIIMQTLSGNSLFMDLFFIYRIISHFGLYTMASFLPSQYASKVGMLNMAEKLNFYFSFKSVVCCILAFTMMHEEYIHSTLVPSSLQQIFCISHLLNEVMLKMVLLLNFKKTKPNLTSEFII